MPAGVRVQQLTPIIRASSTHPTTIVRLMSPATSTIRPGTGQQQIIQLNTNKQQQPLVIKAITASTSNRQQPILLTSNTQTKTILPQNQQQQQFLVLNQGQQQQQQQQKFTLQITNDNGQQESTTDNSLPQLDGTVDDLQNGTSGMFNKEKSKYKNYFILLVLPNSSSPISQQQTTNVNSDDSDGWHLIGTFKTTTADVKHYYVVPSKINIDNYVCLIFFS
jgi:hypothetical protein